MNKENLSQERQNSANGCSICQSPDIHFIWVQEDIDFCAGFYSLGSVSRKIYCQECYEEYGGV